jgi:cytochrome c oxidase cbb3-type subunit 3
MTFWSSWVTIISLGCWVFIAGVLLLTLKKWKPTLEEDGTTGHEYDGVKEFDKPMPKWWLVIFFGSLAWGLVYMALYPSIVPYFWKGLSSVEVGGEQVHWTSKTELASNLEANNRVFMDNFNNKLLVNPAARAELDELERMQVSFYDQTEESNVTQADLDAQVAKLGPAVMAMVNEPRAIKAGAKLFQQNCSVCHGSAAKGSKGYPNLTDESWLYGGKASDILLTLHNGRVAAMPAWQADLGETGIAAAVEHVYSYTHSEDINPTLAAQGKALFEANCSVCHGKDGKGSQAIGAPNLTDDIWLYGGDRDTLKETLRYGRNGVMPAWQQKLGNERIMLLSAYVYQLSDHTGPGS